MDRSHQLRCVRSNVALSAVITNADSQQSEFASLVNLSGTGCLLEAPEAMEIGEVVFMRFSLPGQMEVETEARVARVGSNHIGVAFDQITEASAERIMHHVVQEGRRRR